MWFATGVSAPASGVACRAHCHALLCLLCDSYHHSLFVAAVSLLPLFYSEGRDQCQTAPLTALPPHHEPHCFLRLLPAPSPAPSPAPGPAAPAGSLPLSGWPSWRSPWPRRRCASPPHRGPHNPSHPPIRFSFSLTVWLCVAFLFPFPPFSPFPPLPPLPPSLPPAALPSAPRTASSGPHAGRPALPVDFPRFSRAW